MRRLAPLERWNLGGGNPADWDLLLARSVSSDQAVRAVKRAGPPGSPCELASQMCQACGARAVAHGRCGVVRDPEDDETLRRMAEWCGAWKIDPDHQSRALPKGVVPRKDDTVQMFGPGPAQKLDRVGGRFEDDWAPLRELIRQKREQESNWRSEWIVGAVPRRRNDIAAVHGVGLRLGVSSMRFGKESQALRETETGQARERRRGAPRRTARRDADEMQDLSNRTVLPTPLTFGGGSSSSTSGMPTFYQPGGID